VNQKIGGALGFEFHGEMGKGTESTRLLRDSSGQ
jgi:hypothetical protein